MLEEKTSIKNMSVADAAKEMRKDTTVYKNRNTERIFAIWNSTSSKRK